MTLYPDEAELARLVLGPKRAKDWPAIAAALEKRGFPQINPLMGGRYWPAVEQFFRVDNNMPATLSASPKRVEIIPGTLDGVEDFSGEKTRSPFGRRPLDRTRRTGS